MCIRDRFSVVLAVLSALMGVPALLRTFGFCLDFPASAAFWAVGALSSSFVYLKTGPFFVWLRRAKLMRCIAIAFLSASILYLLAFFLDSVVGIEMCIRDSSAHCELVHSYVDGLQVGARNFQNFSLLKKIGQVTAESHKMVLYKRGFAGTIAEWLAATDYLTAEGNDLSLIHI